MPWMVKKNGEQWCVHKQDADGNPMGDSLGCHASEEEAMGQMRALHANVEEQAQPEAAEVVRETVNDTVVSEFGGVVPSVPFAPGVNVEELLTGDADPMFLVLPISEEGKVSKNGLLHDGELAESLLRQIVEEKPGGIMGHISDQERSSAYPVSQVHWVGATRHGGRVWAKGYIPKSMPEVREEFRVLKAKGGKAATSIYGRAVKEFEQGNTRRWRARQFVLEQIDLAPYSRASLPGSGEFALTAEMEGEPTMTPTQEEQGKGPTMEKQQLLAELTAEDIKALPQFKDLREAVIREYEAEHETTDRIAELEQENTAKTQRVAELEADVEAKALLIAEFQAVKFDADLDAKVAELTDWQVTSDEGKAKVASLRSVIKKMALAQMGTVREMAQAETTLNDLLTGDLKALVEMTRDALAGPAVVVPGKDRDKGAVAEFDWSDEASRKAMAEMGLSV